MNLPITSFLYSLEDRVYMLEKLSRLEQGAFQVKKSFEEQVHAEFSLPIAESILQSALDANILTTSAPALQKFLKDQQDAIKALPVVTLRLAFTPSHELFRSISKWFDTQTGRKTLISVVVDSSIVGGAAIELNGSYIDYSLKKLLHEKLNSQKPDDQLRSEPIKI